MKYKIGQKVRYIGDSGIISTREMFTIISDKNDRYIIECDDFFTRVSESELEPVEPESNTISKDEAEKLLGKKII